MPPAHLPFLRVGFQRSLGAAPFAVQVCGFLSYPDLHKTERSAFARCHPEAAFWPRELQLLLRVPHLSFARVRIFPGLNFLDREYAGATLIAIDASVSKPKNSGPTSAANSPTRTNPPSRGSPSRDVPLVFPATKSPTIRSRTRNQP